MPLAAARHLFRWLRPNAFALILRGLHSDAFSSFPSHVLFMGWWRQVRGRGQCPRTTSQPERPGASRHVGEPRDCQTYAYARKIHAGRPRGQCFPTHPSLCPYEAARLVVAPRAAAHARPTRTPAHQPEALVLALGDGANRSRAANASSLFFYSRRAPLNGRVALFCLFSPPKEGGQPRRTQGPAGRRPLRHRSASSPGDHRRHGYDGGFALRAPCLGFFGFPSRSQPRPKKFRHSPPEWPPEHGS